MGELVTVWSISGNVFQPMDCAADLVGYCTTEKYNKKYFSEAL